MQLRGTLILFFVLSTLAEGQNTSCGNDFKTLETALLQTGNNTLKLLQAFYPPRQPPATFVTVHYTFLNADGNIICNTTWFWSSVEFYLIQHPTIFVYTSLFFTIPQDRITTANIFFKDDCQGLVTWNENGSCTCTRDGMLDILTQRLKFYAKVNNADDINIDDDSLAAAVCEDEQNKDYSGTAVVFFVICGVLIPISFIILLVVIILSSRAKISAVINKEQNHANLAALALTGLVFSTFVVVLDFVAVGLVVQEKHDFPTIHSNLYSLIIVTILDAIGVLVAYTAVACIALAYINTLLHFRCPKCSKPQIVWLVIFMCFAPPFCLASHSGYIIVAWLSDTQHGGPAIFFYVISFLYYFIIFRQLYKFCNRKLPETRRHPKASFNPFVFFIEILLGVILVGAEAFVIYSLIVLPITVTTAPTVGSLASFPGRTRSANVFQLAFLIITGFFTYKFIYTEDEPKQFMNAFVTCLRNKNLKDVDLKNLQDAEAAGKVAGEVAYTIIQRQS